MSTKNWLALIPRAKARGFSRSPSDNAHSPIFRTVRFLNKINGLQGVSLFPGATNGRLKFLCYKSPCQEDKRSKDRKTSKLFSKKLNDFLTMWQMWFMLHTSQRELRPISWRFPRVIHLLGRLRPLTFKEKKPWQHLRPSLTTVAKERMAKWDSVDDDDDEDDCEECAEWTTHRLKAVGFRGISHDYSFLFQRTVHITRN